MRHCLSLSGKNSLGIQSSTRMRLFFALLALIFSQTIFAQGGIVKGRVTSGDTALPSVTVRVKGLTTAAATDANGNFTISAAPDATLIFSSVGYGSQEVKVNNRTNITVSLQSSASVLDQIVVVGYGTQKKRDVTGAVSSVNAETIAKVPVVSATQALQGRAA